MSLRPEEILRKALAAGYGNLPPATPQGAPEDDTAVSAVANGDLEYGDWVVVQSLSSGCIVARKPTEDGQKTTLGVVLHKAASGECVRVKTTGVCIAKVDSSATLTAGDLLGTKASQTYAIALSGPCPCGRFFARFSGDDRYAWVAIVSGQSEIVVHHHDDTKNTNVSDVTVSTRLTAPVWHILKVTDINYTGTPDPRLMLALGGGSTHGETPKEGWGWAGVIGTPGSMGFGQIGGNEAGGNQGVLGAETAFGSEGLDYRINVRSWAGFNARDRYGAAVSNIVNPLRFTVGCDGETAPKWYVPDGCDCYPGVTPSEPCDPSIVWWSGTLRRDPTVDPHTLNHTSWHFQWTPQFALERDCCELTYSPVTPPDFDCGTISNPNTFETNAADVSGPYEGLIPWGYTPCTGRLDTLHSLCYFALHIRSLWRFLMDWSSVVEQMFVCIDARLAALGQPPCCGTVPPATVPTITGGPSGTTCESTAC